MIETIRCIFICGAFLGIAAQT